MKKRKIACVIIVILSMLFTLCACGGSDTPTDDPVLGIYNGVACEAFGYYGDISEIYDGECTIELKKNEKCVLTLEGEKFDGKYSLSGEELSMEVEGSNCPGTLKEGIICIDFMELGANLYFVKDGVETPDYLLSGGSDSPAPSVGADGAIVYQNAEAVYLRSEIVKDYSDADTIAVYFDFTHNSDGEDSFGWSYYYTFKQGDIELESTSVFPDNATRELAEDVYTDIAPGEHIEICLTYLLNDTTTPVTITFTNMMDDVIGEITVDPSELEGSTIPDGAEPSADANIPADFIGDWHGMAAVYEGTGIYEENVDQELEIISRFSVDAQGNCTPFIALALGDDSADNFGNLSVSYDADEDKLILSGTLLGDTLEPHSCVCLYNGDLYIDAYIDDGDGNYLNIYACLKTPGAEWYEDDYPSFPQDAVDFYSGMEFEEIAELFGLDVSSLPAKY